MAEADVGSGSEAAARGVTEPLQPAPRSTEGDAVAAMRTSLDGPPAADHGDIPVRHLAVLVVGPGAVGGALLAKLLDMDDVRAAALPRMNSCAARALEQDGLKVRNATGAVKVCTCAVLTPGDAQQQFDAALLTTKNADVAAAAAAAAPFVREHGCVISLCNGMGHEMSIVEARFCQSCLPNARARRWPAALACLALTRQPLPLQAVGQARAYVGTVSIGAHLVAPADVKLAGGGTVAFGPVCASEAGGTREVAERVAQTLSRAGVHASVVEGGVQNTLWRKLIVNAAVNPICALAGVRNGALRTGALRVLADAVVVEACAVARAKSVGDGAADTGAMLEFVHDVIDKTAENLCSMACDVEAGRVTESDAITGFLVRTAQAHKVPIPRIETLHALVKGRDGAV